MADVTPPGTPRPTIRVEFAGRPIEVEVETTPPHRARAPRLFMSIGVACLGIAALVSVGWLVPQSLSQARVQARNVRVSDCRSRAIADSDRKVAAVTNAFAQIGLDLFDQVKTVSDRTALSNAIKASSAAAQERVDSVTKCKVDPEYNASISP